MNVITINDAAQLTNQLVDGFEKNKTKSSVEGTVILNRDNGLFPTAMKLCIVPDKDDSERITLSFLYFAIMGTEIPGYQFAWQTTTIDELKVLCSNVKEFESWLTKPLSKDNQEVPFEFNEERLSINKEFERPSDDEITNYLNEFFEHMTSSNGDIAKIQLTAKEVEDLVNDVQAVESDERIIENNETVPTYEQRQQNTSSVERVVSTQDSGSGFGGLIVAAGLAGLVFSAGVAVGITLPFIGATK